MPSLSPKLQGGAGLRAKPTNKMRLYAIISRVNLLEQNSLETESQLAHEVTSNPALEIVEGRICPSCQRKLAPNQICPKCSYEHNGNINDPIVFVSPPQMSFRKSNMSKDYSSEEYIASKESLTSFVLNQINNDIDRREKKIIDYILSYLDENTGLLDISLEDIIINQKVPKSKVDTLIELINSAEPISVGSFTAIDAMIYQVKHLDQEKKIEDKNIIIEAIRDHMRLIATKDYSSLAKELNISKVHAEAISDFISSNLNPYPAQSYWGDERSVVETKHHAFYQPDFIIHVDDHTDPPQLIVEVLYPLYGALRVNSYYQKALNNDNLSDEQKEKLKNDVNNAKSLINLINGRNSTLVQFIHWIVKEQREYILYGDKFMRPITQKNVAEALDVEESTISRAVKGKTVQLPSNKLIPCSKFFEKNLPIRVMINEYIANEDKRKPLSDQKICDLLQKDGIDIARRTVTKYREKEGHLNASNRKKRS